MALSPVDLVRVTTQSLLSSPLRSGLTTLGVFMGVAAVNATLQVGNISSAITRDRLAERESPRVEVSLWNREGPRPQASEVEVLKQRLHNWQSITASSYSWSEEVIFRGEAKEAQVTPVLDGFLQTTGRQMVKGRALNQKDAEGFRAVMVIDELLEEQLFPSEEALGQQVIINGNLYQVVGVMERKSFGYEWADSQGFAVIPLSVFSATTGFQGINRIMIRAHHLNDLEPLKLQAESLLQQRFPGADIWSHSNVEEILAQKEIWDLAGRALTGVGIISLLISGVGIANITIAAVIERTSEIGLRRAIGATRREIMAQFILEAVVLSLVGGMGAIATVHGLTLVISKTFQLPYQFESKTAALSLGSAVLVGVGACFVPALRASRLDPVKALREA